MGFKEKVIDIYDKHYKPLLIIPILILVFSLLVIGHTYFTTGDFIHKGISLKGGTTVTIQKENINSEELQKYLEQKFKVGEISVRELTLTGKNVGAIIEASDINAEELIKVIKEKMGNDVSLAVETIGESLGQSFFKEALKAVLLAFVFMSIVVFLYFFDFAPALYVVLSAFFDMVFAVALVDIFGIKVGTAGIAAFLMLIGYSVDTDILLTARVLKNKEGTVFERALGSVKTGITMTGAAIAAALIAYYFTPSEVLKEIMLILFFGLLADIPSTWLLNSGLLRMHMETLEKKQHSKSAHSHSHSK